ncbi:LacI family DNA-binding transcriptional regulator [Hoeflea sp.]|uniref:LacI family DNA-binding transcriptional regulator n=1 Tax=Hoeflea sp. TaxID=1940281 RepID=UPI003B01EC8D
MNLKELSERLGLSQTTVSRALNGYPEVGEATRERVLVAAKLYNYNPNSRAKALATGRAMVIGHVLPATPTNELMSPIFGDFLAGAANVYQEMGYDLMLSLVTDDRQEDAYRRLATTGSVDGVIVHSPRVNDRRIDMLNKIGLPFVVHGRASEVACSYNWVDISNRRAFRRAAGFLIDLGHRRIGLINGIDGMDYALRRHHGYLDALATAGIEMDPDLICGGEMTEIHGYTEARRMLSLKNRPTALLVSSMISAVGARRAIFEAGLVLGKDISVITHDDDLSYMKNGEDVPIFTSTKSPVGEAARVTAEAIIDLIKRPSMEPINHLIEAHLVVGQSTGPAPQN